MGSGTNEGIIVMLQAASGVGFLILLRLFHLFLDRFMPFEVTGGVLEPIPAGNGGW